MNELPSQHEMDANDPLLSQMTVLKPASAAGFDLRVAFAAGRAEAAREYSSRASSRAWTSAAAMVFVAIGSSVLTWNFSPKSGSSNNDIASVSDSMNPELGANGKTETDSNENDSVAVAVKLNRTSEHRSLDSLLEEMLRDRLPSPVVISSAQATDRPADFEEPISLTPPTLFRLQRELLENFDHVF